MSPSQPASAPLVHVSTWPAKADCHSGKSCDLLAPEELSWGSSRGPVNTLCVCDKPFLAA